MSMANSCCAEPARGSTRAAMQSCDTLKSRSVSRVTGRGTSARLRRCYRRRRCFGGFTCFVVCHALAGGGLHGGADVGEAVEKTAEILGVENQKIGRARGRDGG